MIEFVGRGFKKNLIEESPGEEDARGGGLREDLESSGASTPGVVVGEVFEGTDGGDDGVNVAEVVPSDALDVLDGDGVDAEESLDGGETATEGEDLAADVLSESGRAVELQEVGGLDAVLGAFELLGRDGAKEGEFAHEFEGELLDAVVGSDEGDAEETSGVVGGVEGGVGVGEGLVASDFGEARVERVATAEGLVPGANEVLEEEEGEVVGVRPGGALEGDGASDFVEGIVSDLDLRTDEFGLEEVGVRGVDVSGGVRGDGAEVLLGELNDLFVLNGTGGRDHHPLSHVVTLQIRHQIVSRQRRYILLLSQDRLAQR